MGHEWEASDEFEVAATPEQVWEAIATGPGLDAWYMGRSEVDPYEGGAMRTDVDGHVTQARITAYEPGRRFATHTSRGDDGSFFALEWIVEGRDAGSTVVRSVGSGFIGHDDWEGEYDATRAGGRYYAHTLRQVLTYFMGRRATSVSLTVRFSGPPARAWPALLDGLALAEPPPVGAPVRLAPPGLAPIDGVVDYDADAYLGVRTEDALYRFLARIPSTVSVEHHLFSDVDGGTAEESWREWLRLL
jgi:uncharacterized protein YndB with AHSA1/START domain